MASPLSDVLAAEEADELPEVDHELRKPNAFELARLAEDPCRPIYMSLRTEAALSWAYYAWRNAGTFRQRAVPVTCDREFVRAEGHS